MSPDIVLADEPTGNVDWEMSERLLRLLLELNRMGKTVVIASHDLALFDQQNHRFRRGFCELRINVYSLRVRTYERAFFGPCRVIRGRFAT